MTGKKQLLIAKILFKKSLTGDTLDTKKVNMIIAGFAKNRPQSLISILRSYKRLVEGKIRSEEIVIETGVKLPSQKLVEKNLMSATGAKRVIYRENPSIVFGAKITNGDWVWDNTLKSKLKQLIEAWTSSKK